MTELQASRTLVKSPPELWAECSDAASLARHLGQFGEIRITRLEPETTVAWEGERARGTVQIEPAGWGTKVILTAVAEPSAVEGPDVAAEPEVVEEPGPPDPPEPAGTLDPPEPAGTVDPPEPAATADPPDEQTGEAPLRRRRFARVWAFLRGPDPSVDPPGVDPPPGPVASVAVAPVAEPDEEPPVAEPPPPAVSAAKDALTAALDSLGQAHHRPYSRA